MAKKRTHRSSEPLSTEIPDHQPQQTIRQEQEQEELQPIPEDEEQEVEVQEEVEVEEEVEEEEEEEEEEEDDDDDDDDDGGGGGGGGGENEHGEGEEMESQTLAASKEDVPSANGGKGACREEDLEEEPIEKLLEPFGKDQLIDLIKKAVDKHPEFIRLVREIADADPAHRKIFVHGLSWDTTAETLTNEFSKYGEIEECKAVTDRVSGKSKGYAFILFKHRSGARRALQQPQKKIGNRTTSCQLASQGPVPAPVPSTPPVSEYALRKIFVSNVSADLDPEKLLDFFRQYGEIEEGPLGLDKQTGRPKGFALFVYRNVDSARKALEEPHKNFEGHTLHCQKAIDGPKPSKGSYSGASGGHHQQHQQAQHQLQPHYHHAKKGKYSSGGTDTGHLMAPSGPAPVGFNPGMASGFNPGVAAAAPALNPAFGQALTALLASQGAGLGLGNLLGGIGGAPVNQGAPAAGYPNQVGGYVNQMAVQGGYQNPQMGQGTSGRTQPGGGAPYMGH